MLSAAYLGVRHKKGRLMEKFLHYWKQGWKFQLAMVLFHVCVAILLVPIALWFNLDKASYYAAAVPIYVVVLVPVGGVLSWWLRSKPPEADDR
jgi:H+/Cl- antiporter ClcA